MSNVRYKHLCVSLVRPCSPSNIQHHTHLNAIFCYSEDQAVINYSTVTSKAFSSSIPAKYGFHLFFLLSFILCSFPEALANITVLSCNTFVVPLVPCKFCSTRD